jgi:hypothetical protein
MPISRINTNSIANNTIQGADLLDASITAAKIVSIANTQITGNIVSSQITSVANTQISGNIISSQIASVSGSVITANTIANSAIQTGAVENYMRGASLDFGMRNRIINGAMVIDQRNAGASVATTVTGTPTYTLDRFAYQASQASKYTVQQNAAAVTPPTGFLNYLGVTSTSAYSVLTGDFFLLRQPIEGFNTADLGFGTASASTVTLSFWVRSSLTGTFGGSLGNSSRSYPFSYTISVANTWEQKSITIAGDTSGTWVGATNATGMILAFSLGMGSTYSTTAGAWAAGNYLSTTGATSVVGTSGATFYITGVQLEKGSTATSFDYRPYGTELALCQRYFQKWNGATSRKWVLNGMILGTNDSYGNYILRTTMRAEPTLATSGTASDYCLYAGNALFICSSVPTLNTPSVDTPNLNFKSTGMTDGRASLCGSNTDNGSLTFIAEL